MVSLITRSASNVLFGKVITTDLSYALKVCVDKYLMDERLTMYFKEKTEIYAYDKTNSNCKDGDYVLLREDPHSDDPKVNFSIIQKVYELGNIMDPVSGKQIAGTEYIDDINRLTSLFGRERPYQKSNTDD